MPLVWPFVAFSVSSVASDWYDDNRCPAEIFYCRVPGWNWNRCNARWRGSVG